MRLLNRKTIGTTIAAILVGMAIISTRPQAAVGQSLWERLKSYRAREARTRQSLKAIKTRQHQANTELVAAQQELEKAEARLSSARKKLAATREELKQTKKELGQPILQLFYHRSMQTKARLKIAQSFPPEETLPLP